MEKYLKNREREDSSAVRRKGDVIHSGHFMISSVADDQEDLTEAIDHDRDSPVHHEQSIMIKHGYDFSNVAMETKDTYQFGPSQSNHITIDASLSRLFQCMSLAYRGGKVVSPKWKNFKGMKLTVKDKIRLNNAIWRTWHIQYVMMKQKQHSFIQFVTPMEIGGDYDTHTKPEAVVMEGKYWKRRIETVVAEYKKWRAYFMERCITSSHEMISGGADAESFKYSGEDQPYTDFTDTLFSSLSQQPFQFPNPREIALHATNSDMIQPGLLQLQPTVDDFDFDPLQDFFNTAKKSQTNVFGAGNSSHTEFSSINDPFISSDIASVLEHHIPNTTSLTTLSTVSSQQTGGFGMQHYQHVESLSVAEPAKMDTNHIRISANHHHNAGSTKHSPSRNMSGSAGVSQHGPVRPAYLTVEQVKRHNSHNNYRMDEAAAMLETRNRGQYVTDNHNRQASVPFPYPHSKQGPNQPLDRIIYTNTQMGINTFQQNPGLQQLSPNNVGSSATQIGVGQVNPDQPAVRIVKHKDEKQQSSESSNVFLLKQLLTNKSNADKSRSSQRQDIQIPKVQGIDSSMVKTNMPLPVKQTGQVNSSANISPTKSYASDPLSFSDVSMEQGEEFPATFVDDGTAMLQRSGSFSAEQKRRFNIKLGFNRLQKYLPNCNVQSNTKISKASLMNKATQYIKSLQGERQKVADEIQALKQELDELKSAINSCQQQLPATGAPVSRPHIEESKTKYKHWVKERTKKDWKFFMFGIIIEPWFESYQCMVSVTSTSDLCRSVFDWVDQKCALPVLRPSVVQSLQVLSTSTSILTQPLQLQKQIEDSVQDKDVGR